VIALIVIGISGYAGYSSNGHFNSAYVAMSLGVFMELLACCGLLGAKLESVRMLVVVSEGRRRRIGRRRERTTNPTFILYDFCCCC
jgi:hypothetical protein